jgi:Phospholipase_D-nuclease N-terminal
VLILIYLGAVALTTWALLDVAQTPAESISSLSKGSWALLVVIPYVGPAAWFLLGTADRQSPEGPLGPDDDPEFLRSLGQRRDRPE